MKKSFIYSLLLLLFVSCGENLHTNYATEEQTDKKFVGKWKKINDPNDSRTFQLRKTTTNIYRFDGTVLDMQFEKYDDNTLKTLMYNSEHPFKLEYHPNNDHITVTDYEETQTDEFIRVE
jgi:hypothetical protein